MTLVRRSPVSDIRAFPLGSLYLSGVGSLISNVKLSRSCCHLRDSPRQFRIEPDDPIFSGREIRRMQRRRFEEGGARPCTGLGVKHSMQLVSCKSSRTVLFVLTS